MKNLNTRKKGFALFEIILVIAVLAIILSLGMTVDLSSFRRDTFLTEQWKLASILQRARSRAMSNMFDTNHGVCYTPPDYIIFKGDDYTDGESAPANTNITITFPSSPIVFDRLTGKTTGATIHLTDGIKSADITINNEGTIDW